MKTIDIEEVSNNQLRKWLEIQKRDGDLATFCIKSIFQHRYEGGQCDWGYVVEDGEAFAFYGSDIDCELRDKSEIYDDRTFSQIRFA